MLLRRRKPKISLILSEQTDYDPNINIVKSQKNLFIFRHGRYGEIRGRRYNQDEIFHETGFVGILNISICIFLNSNLTLYAKTIAFFG